MGLMIKAAVCFLFFFAILHSHVSAAPTTAAAQKTVTTTPVDLTEQAATAPAPTSGTGGGADYCAAKCRDRCKTVSPETLAEICEGICELCCAKNNNCVPPGPVGENREQCEGWTRYRVDEGLVYRCP